MDRYQQLWTDGVESFRRGDYESTAVTFQAVLTEYSCDAEARERAHGFRGLSFQLLGDYRRALAEFKLALDANPQSTWAMSRLAYLLAMAPDAFVRDGEQSKRLAAVAASRSHEHQWAWITILAAAQAETGDFQAAAATYQRALTMMPDAERSRRAGRLEQLKAGQPLRCNPEIDRLNMFEINRPTDNEANTS